MVSPDRRSTLCSRAARWGIGDHLHLDYTALADERARADRGPCRMRRAHELAFHRKKRLELCHAIAFELGGRPVMEGVHHYHIAEIGPERLQPPLQSTKCRPRSRLEGFRGAWRARLLPYHDT